MMPTVAHARAPVARDPKPGCFFRRKAFTLIELLVVIAISPNNPDIWWLIQRSTTALR
ncbi:MAG: type II secretion system protein [Verrucomicrobiales bacterium]|nr:type II secretion system protein [Verrucomicrobiales bacterium]